MEDRKKAELPEDRSWSLGVGYATSLGVLKKCLTPEIRVRHGKEMSWPVHQVQSWGVLSLLVLSTYVALRQGKVQQAARSRNCLLYPWLPANTFPELQCWYSCFLCSYQFRETTSVGISNSTPCWKPQGNTIGSGPHRETFHNFATLGIFCVQIPRGRDYGWGTVAGNTWRSMALSLAAFNS